VIHVARPTILLVRNLPAHSVPSVIFMVPVRDVLPIIDVLPVIDVLPPIVRLLLTFMSPFTSSFDPGVFVQIPTLPVAVTLIL
jgi:hypothetical protein